MAHEDHVVQVIVFDDADDVLNVCAEVRVGSSQVKPFAHAGQRLRKDLVLACPQQWHKPPPGPCATEGAVDEYEGGHFARSLAVWMLSRGTGI